MKPHRWPRMSGCSSTLMASRWRSTTPSSADARWAPRRRAPARDGAPTVRQAAVGPPLRSGDTAVRERLSDVAAPEPVAGRREVPEERPGGRAPTFYNADGSPKAVGTSIRNPEFAATLRAIAAGGADAFYSGPDRRRHRATVRSQKNAGHLATSDFAAYRVKQREPFCTDYKRWRVCGMPPPSSGGIAVAQMLGIFTHRNIAVFPPDDAPALEPRAEAVHLFSRSGSAGLRRPRALRCGQRLRESMSPACSTPLPEATRTTDRPAQHGHRPTRRPAGASVASPPIRRRCKPRHRTFRLSTARAMQYR